MRLNRWKKILLLSTVLLLLVLTACHSHQTEKQTIAEKSAVSEIHSADSMEKALTLTVEAQGKELSRATIRDQTLSELFRFDTTGGAVVVSWIPESFLEDDSVEITVVGAEYQRGTVLKPEQAVYVFGDGTDGEQYEFTAQIRHSDGSIGEQAGQTVVLHQNTADQHDLPILWIETKGRQNPSYLVMEKPEGAIGAAITDNQFVKGVCRIINLGSADDTGYTAKIRVRGNTSAALGDREGKKPYKLVLDTPVDLFENGRAEKRFVLLATGTDLKSYLGFMIAQILEMDWAQDCRFVNVVLNGDWKGLYLITEALDADIRDDHIGADGLLIEYDAYWWKEDYYFRTKLSSDNMAFTVKYPETGLNSEEAALLQKYVEKLEDGILDQTEFNNLDIESFVKWIMARDLLGHGDPCGSNMFYYLRHWNTEDPSAEKLFMGPLWDFDAAFSFEDKWSDQRDYPSWFYWLFQDPRFRERYVNDWNNYKQTLYPALSSALKESCDTYGGSVDLARTLDKVRWAGDSVFLPVAEEAEQRLNWLRNRIDWMSGATEKMADEIYGNGDLVAAVSKDCTSLGVLLRDRDYTDVSFAVWSELDGQNDLHWYQAEKGNDGSWSCMADLYNHRSAGLYIIHAYEVTDGNTSFLEEYRCFVRHAVFPKEYIALDPIDSSHIRISLVSDLPHEQIAFPVWSEADGQDDLIWYQGSLNQDGIWSYILDLDRHTREGLLNVHAYETGRGESILLDCASVYLGPQ